MGNSKVVKRICNFEQSDALRKRAHDRIPAGCHTYSKGDDQFPQLSPGFIVRGSGVRVWDVDGNEFLDWGMGLRSVILGHCYQPVLEAVRAQLDQGANFTRPSLLELELADRMATLIPAAEMFKFAKNGSDATTAAVRLARAFTGRDKVVVCQDHPFFSFDDWFIGSTPPNAGIPEAISRLTLRFPYNDLPALQTLFAENAGEIACIIMEAATLQEPLPGFLQEIRRLTQENGALLILDEMITGFRWHLGGAQRYYDIKPDLSTFGKAIANGFSVAAVAGRRDVMELGGIRHSERKVFLLSSTHGGETHCLAAALATLRELEDRSAVDALWSTGRLLQKGVNELATRAGLADYVQCVGYPCSPAIVCKDERGVVSMPFRTLFLQETIAAGVLIPYIAIAYQHTPVDVERTLEAVEQALQVYGRALEDGVDQHLVGPAVKPVFRAFN